MFACVCVCVYALVVLSPLSLVDAVIQQSRRERNESFVFFFLLVFADVVFLGEFFIIWKPQRRFYLIVEYRADGDCDGDNMIHNYT